MSALLDDGLDEDAKQTLAMSPEAIRADLAAMGCDVRAIEAEAHSFLQRPKKPARIRRFALIAGPLAALVTLAETLAPSIPLPLVARAPSNDPPAITAAAPLPSFTQLNPDGGSR